MLSMSTDMTDIVVYKRMSLIKHAHKMTLSSSDPSLPVSLSRLADSLPPSLPPSITHACTRRPA